MRHFVLDFPPFKVYLGINIQDILHLNLLHVSGERAQLKYAPRLGREHLVALRRRKYLIKDIVQPKKRGVKRGTIRFVLTSYTIAAIF